MFLGAPSKTSFSMSLSLSALVRFRGDGVVVALLGVIKVLSRLFKVKHQMADWRHGDQISYVPWDIISQLSLPP